MTGRRVARLAALTFGVVMVAAAVQAAGAPSASALPGLERVVASSLTDAASSKGVTAWCAPGKRVLAGGGWVFGADSAKVMLTSLIPKFSPLTGRDGWFVRAAEVLPSVASDWRVEAYAICSVEPSGYERLSTSHHLTPPWNSQSNKGVGMSCPIGKRVIGVGAEISGPGTSGEAPGQVMFRFINMSNFDLPVVEASAMEDVDGFDHLWNVSVHATCGDVTNVEVDNWSTLVNSEDVKTAHVACDRGTFVHGVASLVFAPRFSPRGVGVGINGIRPSEDLRSVTMRAAETSPIPDDWDLNVGASCGP